MSKQSNNLKFYLKTAILVTLLVLALALAAGCGTTPSTSTSEPTSSTTTPSSAQPTNMGYVFVYRDVDLVIAAPADPIIDALGEPINFFEADSCAFQGKDRIYTYAGMEFQTYAVDGVEYIYSVSILDDTVETPEGIALGASADDVKAAYGDGFTESTNQLLYAKDSSQLKFIFDSGDLVAIEYILLHE